MTTEITPGPGQVPDYDDDPFAPREMHEDASQLNGRRVTMAPTYSDEAITLSFVDKFESDFRYVTQFGRWYVWKENKVWAEDTRLTCNEFVRNEARLVANQVNNKPGLARSIASGKTSASVERLLRSEQKLNLPFDVFDNEKMLLNTPTGVVDLSTGQLLPHAREYYMTKITAVGPSDMATPIFNKFLDEITCGDLELAKFLQRMAGYCLTGEIKEQAFFFFYGTGANGKSVFLNLLFKIMGDYVQMCNIDNFMESQDRQHSTGIAALAGARMVWTTEIAEGKKWETSAIKAVTGGDPIVARFMRQDNFTFNPIFKLIAIGNFKPQFKSVNPAMQRRMNLIPFLGDFRATMDLGLEHKLRAEWPGILRWAINGCVDWHKNGLQRPDSILQATKKYLDAEDTIQLFISECLVSAAPGTLTPESSIWFAWSAWTKARGQHPRTLKILLASLEQKGYADYWVKDPVTGHMALQDIAIKDGAAGTLGHGDPGPSDQRDYGSSGFFGEN